MLTNFGYGGNQDRQSPTVWYRTLRWRLLLVLLAALIPLLFAPVGPDYYSHRLYQAVWDLGHIFFFALLAYVCVRFLRHRINLSGIGWTLVLLAQALLLGGLVELVQAHTGRSVSWWDVYSDFVGAYIVCVFYSPIHRQTSPRTLLLLRLSLMILLAGVLTPMATVTYDHVLARQQFPLLAGFERATELSRWSGGVAYQRVREHAAEGEYSLQVRFEGSGYEGVSISHFPADWQDYQWLRLSIFNEGPVLNATVRIHDEAHIRGDMQYRDRYNLHFVLDPGWNHLSISLRDVEQAPATRTMDMQRIRNLGMFVHNLRRPGTLYIDHIRLERD